MPDLCDVEGFRTQYADEPGLAAFEKVAELIQELDQMIEVLADTEDLEKEKALILGMSDRLCRTVGELNNLASICG